MILFNAFSAKGKKRLPDSESRKKTVGCLRAHEPGRDPETDKARMAAFARDKGFGEVRFETERASDDASRKSGPLQGTADRLTSGDRLLVSELSDLGRSMPEIMRLLSELRGKGVAVYAMKGSWALDDALDAERMGKVFAMASEIERDIAGRRIRKALQARKAAGTKLGRPRGPGRSKLDAHRDDILALLQLGLSKKNIAKKYGVSSPNLYNWMRKNNISYRQA